MPQWVELPPNLVPNKETKGKSIYATDYSSRRPGFQIHLQKARGKGNPHHPRMPRDPGRASLRASQTGDYMNFKEEYERSLAQATGKNPSQLQFRMPNTAGSNKTAGSSVYREVLSQYMKPSLDLVQQAWKGESSAVKRDRDRKFGLASKRVELVPSPPKDENKNTPTRVLPGMRNWLSHSNEYEKAVVCNFMKHVSKATERESHPRPSTPQQPTKPRPSPPQQTTKPKFANELFYKQRTKSARSQRATDKYQLPPRPRTVSSFRPEDFAKEEIEETWEPKRHEHHADPERGHFDHVHHTDGMKCDACDYYRVKMLLEYLNRQEPGMGEATLRHLLRPRVDPPHDHPAYDYDYMHENSNFYFTNARDRGYFIIAPDWVSERKGVPPIKHGV